MRRRASSAEASWVTGTHEPAHDGEEHVVVLVQQAVAGIGVLLHVVRDVVGPERALEPCGGAFQRAVTPAVGADDRASALEELLGINGHLAVVHARCVEPVPRRQQERETPTHAKPDHPYPSRAGGVAEKPAAHRLDVVEGPPPARLPVAEDRAQAGHLPAPVEKVRCDGKEPLRRQPVRPGGEGPGSSRTRRG
jgi:hypothetical protein